MARTTRARQSPTGLLIAGVLTGVLAALAGVWAFFTVPAHTEQAHRLMFWHIGIQAASMLPFIPVARIRWRNWTLPPTLAIRLTAFVAALLLLFGSGLGGYIVHHGGAGIDPHLLAPEVREGHTHDGAAADHEHTSDHSHYETSAMYTDG